MEKFSLKNSRLITYAALAVAVIAALAVAGYTFFGNDRDTAQNNPPSAPVPIDQARLIGLWKVNAMFQYEKSNDSWIGGPLSEIAPLYVEFTDDGICTSYKAEGGFRCEEYSSYEINGDIIAVDLSKLETNGTNWRYRGKFNGEELELTSETLNADKWEPLIRYGLYRFVKQ